MRVADQGGVTNGLARLFSPLLKKLFPGLPKDSKAARAISMNLSANLLGMGNAATPLGIAAMQELAKSNPCLLYTSGMTVIVLLKKFVAS